MRLKSWVALGWVILFGARPLPACAQFHCLPGGDGTTTPGTATTLTASYSGSLPPGAYIDTYVIWVNGVAHSGQSYTFTPSTSLDPYESVYHATAVKHVFGTATAIGSATDPAGDNRMGDLIAISVGGLQTIEYDGDHPVYSAQLGANVPRPQYQNGICNWGACYTMGDTPTIKFHTSGTGTNNGVTLKYTCTADLVSPDGTSEGMPGWPVPIGPTAYTAGGDTTFSTTALPGFVYIHDLLLSFTMNVVYSVDGGIGPIGHSETMAPLYVVYSTPTAPMATPWFEVLEDSCTWAWHDSTAATVARDETLGLFFSQRFYYPGNTGSYWTDWPNGHPETFLLSSFLASSGYQPGNCVDVSDYLTICANSQGLDFIVQQFAGNPLALDPVTGYFVFTSNPLCVIGSSPANLANYHPIEWAWHQIAFSSSGTVYDVCAAQATDLNGNGYQNPLFNWPWPGEWQTTGSGGKHYGVVDTPAPNTPDPSGGSVSGAYVPAVK